MAANETDAGGKYMENGVPSDVTVSYATAVDAEWLAYDVAMELSDKIYRLREAGEDVQYVLYNLEKAKKTYLDLREALCRGDYPSGDRERFLEKMRQIANVGIREAVRLQKLKNGDLKSA